MRTDTCVWTAGRRRSLLLTVVASLWLATVPGGATAVHASSSGGFDFQVRVGTSGTLDWNISNPTTTLWESLDPSNVVVPAQNGTTTPTVDIAPNTANLPPGGTASFHVIAHVPSDPRDGGHTWSGTLAMFAMLSSSPPAGPHPDSVFIGFWIYESYSLSAVGALDGANVSLSLTGTPGNMVNITELGNGSALAWTQDLRTEGPPDLASLSDLQFYRGESYELRLTYELGTSGGCGEGSNPAKLTFQSWGNTTETLSFSHTFDAQHSSTYIWTIDENSLLPGL